MSSKLVSLKSFLRRPLHLLELNVDNSEELPTSIDDEGWEDDDLEDDGPPLWRNS